MIEDRRLYLVTGLRPPLADLLEAAIRGGVDIVQIRDKSATDRELLAALELAREVTRRHDVPLVVNDRPDLAQLVGADLVHVGQDDLPTSAVRRLGLPVGLSTHSTDDIDAADAGSAAADTRTGAGVVRRAMVPAFTCTNATPPSAPGHDTSTQEPRLRLMSSTVPICAFPTTVLATVGDL